MPRLPAVRSRSPYRWPALDRLHVLDAQHVEIAECKRTVTESGEECRERRRLGSAGILHGLVVRGELHGEQVTVLGVAVFAEHDVMRYPLALGLRHPLVEVGVELVDPTGLEFDDLQERHCVLHDSSAARPVGRMT